MRFKALGAVHGHDAHFVTALIHVALDFDIGTREPRQKGRQCRRMVVLELERDIEKRIERIIGLGPEPPQQSSLAIRQADARRMQRE